MLNLSLPHKGEIFETYLLHIARINGFHTVKAFCEFVSDSANNRVPYIGQINSLLMPNMPCFRSAADCILKMLQNNLGLTADYVIRNNTIFYTLLSYLSKRNRALLFQPGEDILDIYFRERRIVLSKAYNYGLFDKNYLFDYEYRASSLSEIQYCPDCIKNDTNQYGYPLAHLSHNFPYVRTCHEHNTPLVTFRNGIPGEEHSMETMPSPNNVHYARFVNDFFTHCADENYNGDLIHGIINSVLSENIEQAYNTVSNLGYIDNPMSTLKHGIKRKNHLLSGGDRNNPHFSFCLLTYIFGTYQRFESYVHSIKNDTVPLSKRNAPTDPAVRVDHSKALKKQRNAFIQRVRDYLITTETWQKPSVILETVAYRSFGYLTENDCHYLLDQLLETLEIDELRQRKERKAI